MNQQVSSLENLVDMIKRKAPEYLDLLTATTDVEFETAFDAILGKAVMHLEQNCTKFTALDEEGLTAVLVPGLSVPGLIVARESYSNGHVDITIEADYCNPPRVKLGEAKIYDGPEYHIRGLTQLLCRYTTGREGRGLLIVYVRQRDIAGLVQKLRLRMDEKLPLNQQGKTKDYAFRWSFLTRHIHSSGENLEVGHVGCNLFEE